MQDSLWRLRVLKSFPVCLDQLCQPLVALGNLEADLGLRIVLGQQCGSLPPCLSALAVNERMSFGDLKTLLKTTDGNLSVHSRKLEEAEYVLCEKSFEGRVPKTEYVITPAGRRALERYLDHMESLIRAARER